MFGSSDVGWIFERQFGGQMWDDMEAYLAMSPATYAREIETPVLVLHSENDLRCNIEQGEHLFNLLRVLGKEAEMLRFPAESHELSRSGSPVHRVSGSRRSSSGSAATSRRRSSDRWPREESNLRTQLRRLPLCPLSYGAEHT